MNELTEYENCLKNDFSRRKSHFKNVKNFAKCATHMHRPCITLQRNRYNEDGLVKQK